jgi:hypothetical protein
MLKKDNIFWWATGVFIVAIIIFAISGEQLWLALMIISYLLRPTLASLGIAKRSVDERQMSLNYRSGNIAFAVMIAAAVIMSAIQSAKGDHSFELFNVVIIVGLATKALFNVLLTKNYRQAASTIIMGVGLMMALFSSMEGFSFGTLMEVTPGLLIVGIGWLAKKYPRIIGTVVFILTAVFMVAILWKGFTIGQVTTALIIGIPMILAGVCLFIPDPSDTDPPDSSVPDLSVAD